MFELGCLEEGLVVGGFLGFFCGGFLGFLESGRRLG